MNVTMRPYNTSFSGLKINLNKSVVRKVVTATEELPKELRTTPINYEKNDLGKYIIGGVAAGTTGVTSVITSAYTSIL